MLIMYFFLFVLSAGRTSIYQRIFNKAIHYTLVSFILATSVFKMKVDPYLQTIIDNPCVPNEGNTLDGRLNEMR